MSEFSSVSSNELSGSPSIADGGLESGCEVDGVGPEGERRKRMRKRKPVKPESDLAITARGRRIAQPENVLSAARAEVETLRNYSAVRMATLIVTGHPVALFQLARRTQYVAKALDQVARLGRPAAREGVIRRRVDDPFARLGGYGIVAGIARADAVAVGLLLQSMAGVPSNEGGRNE